MPGNRRSIRLSGYDYESDGAYFVTICTQHRSCLLGNVVVGVMNLNDAGHTIEKWYRKCEINFHGVRCGEYIIMPNHFHAIIQIDNGETTTNTYAGADPCEFERAHTRVRPYDKIESNIISSVGADPCVCPSENDDDRHPIMPLHRVVQWFKTMTTNAYIRSVKQEQWPSFHQRLWQRNYYEHIIRDEKELTRIREYILENPMNWDEDKYNPLNTK